VSAWRADVRALVTGGRGFVGRAVVARMSGEPDVVVRSASRVASPGAAVPGVEFVTSPGLGPDASWAAAVQGVDMVIHAAARVHVMRDRSADPLSEFRRVNVEGTMALARQAASAGVTRFIFLSSVKVNGEKTHRGAPFRADDIPAPTDPYGVSKHEAEVALRELATSTGMEVTIVRPVLVYGPGVSGNFRTMIRWVRRGVPLPLGAVDNRRSLVALDNLVDLLVTCTRHPGAANQTFLVSDGDDLSTPELLRRVARVMGREARLLPVPSAILRALGAMTGQREQVQRLCGDLQVDIAPTRDTLGWSPRTSMATALLESVRLGS
jgi:nucleoside-diphosphate-sugar epimerase